LLQKVNVKFPHESGRRAGSLRAVCRPGFGDRREVASLVLAGFSPVRAGAAREPFKVLRVGIS
jgi:hypothetical protein